MNCNGCKDEMMECYEWQQVGFDAGLNWLYGHCFLFVIDKNGEFIFE